MNSFKFIRGQRFWEVVFFLDQRAFICQCGVCSCTTQVGGLLVAPLDSLFKWSSLHFLTVWWWLLWLSLLEKKCDNCVLNSLVFSYLASHCEWRCLRRLSFWRWRKTEKHWCRSRFISTRSYILQYPCSSNPLNPSPSLFLFFLCPPPYHFSLFPLVPFCDAELHVLSADLINMVLDSHTHSWFHGFNQ